MDKFQNEFSQQLHNFLSDMYTFTNSDNVKKILDVHEKLHTYKTAKKFMNVVGKYCNEIDERDPSIFSKKMIILPGVDMSKLWNKLDKSQQDKIWLYLQVLFISAGMIVQENSEESSKNNTTDATNSDDCSTVESSCNFNPFVGVGNDDSGLSTEDLFNGPANLPCDKSDGSLPNFNLSNFIDISKFIDINTIVSKLKEITDEHIDSALIQLKETLGDELNESTINTISDMFKEISNEIKNINTTENIQITDIISLIETIVGKIIPKLQTNNFDVKNLWKIAQSLSSKFQTNSDNENENNQIKILSSFMDQQFTMMDNLNKNAENGGSPEMEIPKEYIDNCNGILNDLGIKGFDLNKLDMENIDINNMNLNTLFDSISQISGQQDGVLPNIVQTMFSNFMGQPQKKQQKKNKKCIKNKKK